jgi:hypothetical protein
MKYKNMRIALKEEIIKQIQDVDDVILLEIQELLNASLISNAQDEVPLYIQERLEISKQQANNKEYINHADVMKKYI